MRETILGAGGSVPAALSGFTSDPEFLRFAHLVFAMRSAQRQAWSGQAGVTAAAIMELRVDGALERILNGVGADSADPRVVVNHPEIVECEGGAL